VLRAADVVAVVEAADAVVPAVALAALVLPVVEAADAVLLLLRLSSSPKSNIQTPNWGRECVPNFFTPTGKGFGLNVPVSLTGSEV